MWLKGEVVKGADGVINPAHLPWDLVKMRLKAPRPNEQQIELVMRFDKERGLYHEYSFGGQTILTRFTLADKLTTATGAAASVIAKRRNGIWKGDPFTYPVRYGVTRPVRRMVLGQPLSVNGFMLSKMAVRIMDDRGDYRLPVQELPVTVGEQDPDEDILIIGKQRKIFGAPHFWLMIGSDDLSRCSNISYNNRTRRLLLSCSSWHRPRRASSTDKTSGWAMGSERSRNSWCVLDAARQRPHTTCGGGARLSLRTAMYCVSVGR